MTFDAQTLLTELCRLPHRGAATVHEREAARLLRDYLTGMGAVVTLEPFRTPKTYVTIVYWLIGGLLSGLWLVGAGAGWWAVALVWGCVGLAWLYFNWRYSPVIRFPLQHTAQNVVGRWATIGATHTVLLMAHYDTAPVSALYNPKQQATFRASLIGSLLLMLLAAVLATVETALRTPASDVPWLTYGRYGLMLYFTGQALLGTVGYWRHGYTNGASDNATGVAAALATAARLRSVPGLAVEVVLTSAEEAGMIGARAYYERHRAGWQPDQTLIVNFDTLGAGRLTVVEQTGTLEVIHYDNPATQLARSLVDTDAFRHRAQLGRWHTADFDSVWFVRGGFNTLALCALDADGRMPRIHQPADTLAAVDMTPLQTAVDLAEAVVRRWAV